YRNGIRRRNGEDSVYHVGERGDRNRAFTFHVMNIPLSGEVEYSVSPPLPEGFEFEREYSDFSTSPLADLRLVHGDQQSRIQTTRLVGVPVAEQKWTVYTITVNYGSRVVGEEEFYIEVLPPPTDLRPDFGEQAAVSETYVVNTTIEDLELPEAIGGDGALTYTVDGLPEGLNFDGDTRTISGTPTAVQGETTYALTARDEDGDAAIFPFTITVEEDSLPVFADLSSEINEIFLRDYFRRIALPEVREGSGNEPITYTVSPSLPDGLSHNSRNNNVFGTPNTEQERTEYTVTATDHNGDSATMVFSLTILEPRPPRLTVSPAAQNAAESYRTLTFSIALDWAAPKTITVDYDLTIGGTATPFGPDSDYTVIERDAAPIGTLIFPPFSVEPQQIVLSLKDDGEHEEDETVILTLHSLSGDARFPGDADMITVVATIRDNDESQIQEANRRTLARVAVAVAYETSGAVRDRVREAFSGGIRSGVYVRGEDWRRFLAAEASRGNERAEVPEIDLSDLAFTLAASEWGNSYYDSGESTGFRVWGHGYSRNIDVSEDATIKGGLTGGIVGADTLILSNLLTGVSANLFSADMDFRRRGAAVFAHETSAWTVNPYIGWQPAPRSTLWGTVGYGTGDIDVARKGAVCVSPDDCYKSGIRLLTAGAGGSVVMGNLRAGSGRVNFDVTGDVSLVRMTEDISGGLDAEAGTARFGLEFGYGRPLGPDGNIGGDFDLAYRADFGDAETGSGFETGGGLKVTIPSWGLSFSGAGRALLSGFDGVEEWGFSGDLLWSYTSDGTGPYVNFSPQWGATNDRRDELWERGISKLGGFTDGGQRYGVEAGYGVPFMGESGVMTFFARSRMEDGTAVSRSGGVDVEVSGGLTAGYEALSRASRDETEHRGYLRYGGAF
ncbi:MAG: putative Ig domain-containing protein, partial [Candidatus Dadabacteria bacterium]|nr:putative Ig domain-containing protein [Candidatus Dadabacteria bacterium]